MLEWISFSYSQIVNLPKNKAKGLFSTPFISVVTVGLTRLTTCREEATFKPHTYLGEEREEGSGKKTETEDFQLKSQTA